jgi:DNA-nicking Smr family endonuclease
MAEFGDILQQWDDSTSSDDRSEAHRAMESWLAKHPVPAGRANELGDRSTDPRHRPGARRLPVQATLDLHGFRLREAIAEIDSFLEHSRTRGLRKVLIVHGKGYHSTGDPVLKQAVWNHLQRHRLAGALGQPGVRDGGSGAVWVVIRS